MQMITVKDGTKIYYENEGKRVRAKLSSSIMVGRSADDWDAKMMFSLQHGYRVIAHDHQGYGRSTQTDTGKTFYELRPWLLVPVSEAVCRLLESLFLVQRTLLLVGSATGRHNDCSVQR